MQKKPRFERRTYSKIKPFFYLILQGILIWEFFWILTGEAKLTSWNYVQLTICLIMITALAKKAIKIFKRTTKKTDWDDKIQAHRFTNL